jgi:hypothetical protein
VLASACRFGMDATGNDDRVEAEPGRERGDSPQGGDHIGPARQHDAAVDHYPEQLVVGSHGDLRAIG